MLTQDIKRAFSRYFAPFSVVVGRNSSAIPSSFALKCIKISLKFHIFISCQYPLRLTADYTGCKKHNQTHQRWWFSRPIHFALSRSIASSGKSALRHNYFGLLRVPPDQPHRSATSTAQIFMINRLFNNVKGAWISMLLLFSESYLLSILPETYAVWPL